MRARSLQLLGRAPGFFLLLALVRCGDGAPANPGDLARSPDATRDGTEGRDGPHGAGLAPLTAQSRGSESIDVEVAYPALADARLDLAGAPYPTVAIVQEDGATTERYRWLATHLASRGYVVLSPRHPFSQSSYQPENASIALRALRSASASGRGLLAGAVAPSGRAAVAGHGAGASTAVHLWAGGGFDAVAILAGFPAANDDPSQRAGSPALDLAGDQDPARGGLSAYTAGYARFASPRLFGLVSGMTHYEWTDDASDAELRGDGTPTLDPSSVRAQALAVLDAWLDAYLRDDAAARAQIESGVFPGVTVTR